MKEKTTKSIEPPTLSESTIGVYYDLGSSSYIAYYKAAGENTTVEQVGTYPTEDAASLARDIYVLKKLGLSGSKGLLNCSYDIIDTADDKDNEGILSLTHPSGAIVKIRRESVAGCSFSAAGNCSSGSSSNSNSNGNGFTDSTTTTTSTTTIKTAAAAVVSNSPALVSNPANAFSYVAGKADVNRKWHDRVLSSFMPTASFTYELTFPSAYASLGLQLRPHLFPYSITGSRRALACCIVIDATACPSTLVQPGDVLLSVNGSLLLAMENSCEVSYSFDASVRTISQAAQPRTIRFLRGAGLSPNLRVSPAEVILLAGEGHSSVARYTLAPTPTPTGSVSHMNTYTDQQAPDTIRRMLQGQRVVWENAVVTSNLPAGGGYSAYSSGGSAYGTGQLVLSNTMSMPTLMLHSVPHAIPVVVPQQPKDPAAEPSSAVATSVVQAPPPYGPAEKKARVEERANAIESGSILKEGHGGVYRDRNRWAAVIYVPPPHADGVADRSRNADDAPASGRHHLLGQFNTEGDATAAYQWVRDVAFFVDFALCPL